MKFLLYPSILSFFLLILSSCHSNTKSTHYRTEEIACQIPALEIYKPHTDIGQLFHDVQLSGIYEDSKFFVDCKPVVNPDSILTVYKLRKAVPDFNFSAFVNAWFVWPKPYSDLPEWEGSKNLVDDLNRKWDYLTRNTSDDSLQSSLLPLSYPYVVPGGRFREIYYWDSYFTMEGLAASDRHDLIENMLNNFSCLIETYGHIPNGNRSYYLSRSQPPFFAEMVKLWMREKSDTAGLRYLNPLLKEYNFWMYYHETIPQRAVMYNNVLLNRYWDELPEPRPESYKEDYELAAGLPKTERTELYRNLRSACESGWDFSSRWFEQGEGLKSIRTIEILPVDLNSLMYNMEQVLAELYRLKQVPDSAKLFEQKADARKKKIRDIFWDDTNGMFFDFDLAANTISEKPSLAALYPLYFSIASEKQAGEVAKYVRENFLKPGGVVTTLEQTGQQWDAPNGWPPLQWVTICGLENYGYTGLADTIATRWLNLNEAVYSRTGKMMEKYNVVNLDLEAGGGEYPTQDGFGWTNGVYLALKEKGY